MNSKTIAAFSLAPTFLVTHDSKTGIIIPHAGINGGIDLSPGVHGWSDPVTKIEIERVRHKD